METIDKLMSLVWTLGYSVTISQGDDIMGGYKTFLISISDDDGEIISIQDPSLVSAIDKILDDVAVLVAA